MGSSSTFWNSNMPLHNRNWEQIHALDSIKTYPTRSSVFAMNKDWSSGVKAMYIHSIEHPDYKMNIIEYMYLQTPAISPNMSITWLELYVWVS